MRSCLLARTRPRRPTGAWAFPCSRMILPGQILQAEPGIHVTSGDLSPCGRIRGRPPTAKHRQVPCVRAAGGVQQDSPWMRLPRQQQPGQHGNDCRDCHGVPPTPWRCSGFDARSGSPAAATPFAWCISPARSGRRGLRRRVENVAEALLDPVAATQRRLRLGLAVADIRQLDRDLRCEMPIQVTPYPRGYGKERRG